MRRRMSSVAAAVCLASSLTSVATTANPLPASPARAASIVAFRAKRLVCSAMSWMTSMTLPISLAAAPNSAIWALPSPARPAAVPATLAACSALRATSVMLEVSCSTAEDTTRTLADICSVEAATLFMLVDISSAAAATLFDWLVVSSAPLASCVAVAESSVEEFTSMEAPSPILWMMSCSFPTKILNHFPSSPISSLPDTASRLVRSPSPWRCPAASPRRSGSVC